MGGSSKKKQTQEQKVTLTPEVSDAVYGPGGFLPETQKLQQSGALSPTSAQHSLAASGFANAAGINNPLLDASEERAQALMTEGGQQNPYLQQQIDAMTGNIRRDVTRDTATEAAMVGRFGSQAQKGLVAERVGEASQAIPGMIAQDLERRQAMKAAMAKAAPELGAARMQQAADQGLLAQAGAEMDKFQKESDARGAERLGGLLGQGSVGGVAEAAPKPKKQLPTVFWKKSGTR